VVKRNRFLFGFIVSILTWSRFDVILFDFASYRFCPFWHFLCFSDVVKKIVVNSTPGDYNGLYRLGF